MEITKVEIRPMRNEGNLKAFCSVIFDDVFIVHSVKVIEGRDGLFVAMPSREVGEGEYRDIAHPIKNDFRLKLEEKVLSRYHEVTQGTEEPEEEEEEEEVKEVETEVDLEEEDEITTEDVSFET
jgi:stage V sporulation protein G